MSYKHNNRDANERDLIENLKDTGLFGDLDIYRVKSDTPGIPDLHVWYDDRLLMVEVKAGNGRLSPSQEAFIAYCAAHNRPVIVARRAEDVLRWFGLLVE